MLVKQTTELLTQLRDLLQEHELWEAEPPAPERLQSTEPFAVDTLEFHQWLQFIMIPQFEHRIEHNLALPRGFAVSPMAEECWRGCWGERRQLILTLREFDELFS
ncbi:MAG TPA: YqcC family protein [Aliidiomarina sp.]|nr:YqcC family protein [Aliidiomarina sp.]